MNKFLSDVNDSLDQAKAQGFGTDIQEIVEFREFFEEIADHGMIVSRTMLASKTPEMDDSIKTLKAKFKEAAKLQDKLFLDLIMDFGNIEKMDDGLKERAQIFMKMTSDVESMQETPTALQLGFLRFLMIQKRIDAWLDSLEQILPFTAKEKGEEIPNINDMDREKQKEMIKKMMPSLVKLNTKISCLLWAVRGANDGIFKRFNLLDTIKKILAPSPAARTDVAAMIFSIAIKVLPTLKRLMRADTNIEKFLKTCPSKVKSESGKLDKWLLNNIDTKMTVLETELLIGISFLVQMLAAAKKIPSE